MASEALLKKIESYKKSLALSGWDEKSVARECRRLEDKLNIERIEPKQYKMLRKISEDLKVGETPNLEAIARWAGFPEWQVKQPDRKSVV